MRWESAGKSNPSTGRAEKPFGYRFNDSSAVAPPEACLHHGLTLEDGLHYTDVMEMSPEFRIILNREHNVALGYESTAFLNDRAVREKVNPLRLFADILEHMKTRPLNRFWHPRVNGWHQHSPADAGMHRPAASSEEQLSRSTADVGAHLT